MKSLVELVHDLPLELFEEIRELTFAEEHGKVIEITKDYKPSFQLQMNRANRIGFARIYYTWNKFLFPVNEMHQQPAGQKWLASLSEDLENFPETIYYRIPDRSGQLVKATNCWMSRSLVWRPNVRHVFVEGFELVLPCVEVDIYRDEEQKMWWVIQEVEGFGEALARTRKTREGMRVSRSLKDKTLAARAT